MHFPLFLELQDAPCLVVGAGSVARRKVEVLASYGARVTVVAPETLGRPFNDSDIKGQTLVVAATNDSLVNRHIADLCRAKGIPVNAVDDPANCTFFLGAIERKGPITVAVSTNGTCPVAGQVLRDRIRPLLTDDFVTTTERLGAEREGWKVSHPDLASRAAAMRKEFESC